jgi:hypothetical protein
MKRSAITPSISDFEREFQAMKPSVALRSGGLCEARYFAQNYAPDADVIDALKAVKCEIRATNTHHRKYRSRQGTNALSNLIDLCTPCHSWIHAHGKFGGPANTLRLALSANESEEL